MRRHSLLIASLLAFLLSLSLISCDSGGSKDSGSGNNTTDANIKGILDTAFSDDGIVTHNNAAGGNGKDYGHSITVDTSGNIYVVGESAGASYDNMIIWKYKSDGTLDTDFGSNGIVSYDGGTASEGLSIDLDSNGNIYITGTKNNDLVVWKYKSNGFLDTDFASDGIFTYDGGSSDCGYSIKVDSSDKLIICGNSNNGSDNDMILLRLTNNGSYDTTFSTDGILKADNPSKTSSVTSIDSGYCLYLYDNKIYVSGYSHDTTNSKEYMAIWKFTDTGASDITFSDDGIVVHSNTAGGNGYDSGESIGVDSNGNVYVCGESENTDGDSAMTVWKYTSSGNLDGSFGSGGFVSFNNTAETTDTESWDLAIDKNDNIYITGESINSSGNTSMTIWKYTSSGKLDTSFSDDGIFKYCGAAGGNEDESSEIIIYGSSLFVIGSSTGSNNSDMALWKLK